jgi:hypothetical protein
MAQQKDNAQREAQSDRSLENVNPQVLTSEMTKVCKPYKSSMLFRIFPLTCPRWLMGKGISRTCTVCVSTFMFIPLPGPLADNVYRGERTASALESKLDEIHRNLDRLLASFEEVARSSAEDKPSEAPTSN